MPGKKGGRHTGGGSTKLSRGNGTLTITVYSGSGSSGEDIFDSLVAFLIAKFGE